MRREFNNITADTGKREIAALYPGECAQIIAFSLGYATPATAAFILKDAALGEQNYSEWISTCFRGDPSAMLERALDEQTMERYANTRAYARQLIDQFVSTGEQPMLASWF